MSPRGSTLYTNCHCDQIVAIFTKPPEQTIITPFRPMGLQPLLLPAQRGHQHWHLDGAPHHVRPPQGLKDNLLIDFWSFVIILTIPTTITMIKYNDQVDKVMASALPYGRYPILGPERMSVIGNNGL